MPHNFTSSNLMILCFYEYCDIFDLSKIDKWRRSGQIRFSFFEG
jgi:hypothetical protein